MQSEAVPAPCVRCVTYQLLSESRARPRLSLATLVLITTVSVRGRLQLRFDRAGGLTVRLATNSSTERLSLAEIRELRAQLPINQKAL